MGGDGPAAGLLLLPREPHPDVNGGLLGDPTDSSECLEGHMFKLPVQGSTWAGDRDFPGLHGDLNWTGERRGYKGYLHRGWRLLRCAGYISSYLFLL